MREFRTWKQMQTIFTSSPRERSFNSFFKEELSDSRIIVRDVIKEKSIIDLESYRLNIPRINKGKTLKEATPAPNTA